jgi:hypothetical protein
MSSDFDHTITVAVHTVDPLTGLGENELVYPVLANLTFKAMSVVRVVSCHDSLVENG